MVLKLLRTKNTKALYDLCDLDGGSNTYKLSQIANSQDRVTCTGSNEHTDE